MEKLICEVCNKNEAKGVAAIPGVPMSSAYCIECLDANAHPWGALVANTACIGGLEHSANWWQEMVRDTCKHLGKTVEQFNEEVKESIEKFDKEFEQGYRD